MFAAEKIFVSKVGIELNAPVTAAAIVVPIVPIVAAIPNNAPIIPLLPLSTDSPGLFMTGVGDVFVFSFPN
jgi:hypothetical protein